MRAKYEFNMFKYFRSTIVDFILLSGLILAFLMIGTSVILLLEIFSINFSQSVKGWLLLLFLSIIWFVYFFIIFKKTGQTLGMKIFKYKVVSVDNKELSFSQVIWWGIALPVPIIMVFDILNTMVPPHYTLLESLTNTRIVEIPSGK